MQIIQHTELTGTQASIEFTNIPQTFTDLVLVMSLRSSRSTNASPISIGFNGTTINSATRFLYGSTGTTGSFTTSVGWVGTSPGAGSTSNTFGNASIYIPNYRSNTAKSFSSDTVTENNGTASELDIVAGLWDNTAAITSIQIDDYEANNFVQYSSATLYGILKGSSGGVTVS